MTDTQETTDPVDERTWQRNLERDRDAWRALAESRERELTGRTPLSVSKRVSELEGALATAKATIADREEMVKLRDELLARMTAKRDALGVALDETAKQREAANELVADLEKEVADRDGKLAAAHGQCLAQDKLDEWRAWAKNLVGLADDFDDAGLRRAIEDEDPLRNRILELEDQVADAEGEGCTLHGHAPHGKEAEDLRRGIETLLGSSDHAVMDSELQRVLDRVDARDSLAHVRANEVMTEQAERIAELERTQSPHAAEWRTWARRLVSGDGLDNDALRRSIEEWLKDREPAIVNTQAKRIAELESDRATFANLLAECGVEAGVRDMGFKAPEVIAGLVRERIAELEQSLRAETERHFATAERLAANSKAEVPTTDEYAVGDPVQYRLASGWVDAEVIEVELPDADLPYCVAFHDGDGDRVHAWTHGRHLTRLPPEPAKPAEYSEAKIHNGECFQPMTRGEPAADDEVERLAIADCEACGEVSFAEAREIADRYNNSHWKREPYARYTIPADPKRDDDIRLLAFIRQAEATAKERDALASDMAIAAGELLVEIPEPGSVASRLLVANVIMRRERDGLRDVVAAVDAAIASAKRHAEIARKHRKASLADGTELAADMIEKARNSKAVT